MRLIDADALIEKLEKELEVEPRKSIQSSLIKSVCLLFCKVIELEPTVDAVPVIRCENCENFEYINDRRGYCQQHASYIENDGYCNYGKEHEQAD